MSTEVTESCRSSGEVNNVPKVKKVPKTGAERAREYRARIKDIKAAGIPTMLKGALVTLEKQAEYAREYRKRKKMREGLQNAISKQLMVDTIHSHIDNTVVPEGISKESINVGTSTATTTTLQSATIRTDLVRSTKFIESVGNSQEVNNVPKEKKVPKTPAERGRLYRARLKAIKAAGLPTTLKGAVQNPEKKAERDRAYRERRKIRIAQFKQLMKESINGGTSTARRRHCKAQRYEQVQPFDGLPQLICKKCESILSQYDEIKKKFQKKLCDLKSNIKHAATTNVLSTNQDQDTVISTQQVYNECKNQISKTKQKENKIFVSTSINSSLDREPAKDNRNLLGVNKNVAKRSNSVWKNDYEKNFVCRFCAKSLTNKKSIAHHLKQCQLLGNYSNILRRCVIIMNKIDSIPNLTFSSENVVYERNKIINCPLKNYYILYTKKLNEVKSILSNSSDEDFFMPRKKCQIFLTKNSNETLGIENNNTSPSFVKSDSIDEKQKDRNSNHKESTDVSDIELTNIDDSVCASKESRTTLSKAEPIQDEEPQGSTPSKTDTSPNIEVSNNISGGLHMPIITSTTSLAPLNEDETNKESNNESVNKTESETNKSYLALPHIKVKSLADLMPENKVPKSFIDPNSWASCLYNDDQNRLVQNKNNPMMYNVANNKASLTNINSQCPNTNSYSQYNLNKSTDKSTLVSNSKGLSGNKEQYVTMHTVELPHTKTKSPFRYLQQLLQIHNIVLLCNADVVSSNMSCLIKFKLVFHLESSAAVTLCLAFYCKPKTFCIRVMDINSKYLDIDQLSAYWQWAILKDFKGNVVSKLYENASKISSDILQQTYHFVRFLKSIEFSK